MKYYIYFDKFNEAAHILSNSLKIIASLNDINNLIQDYRYVLNAGIPDSKWDYWNKIIMYLTGEKNEKYI